MPYVFVHGLGQTASVWDRTISYFHSLPDVSCPNLWTLLNGVEVTYSNLYHSFADYCEAIPGSLNFCGLSIGAILALNYAIDHPQKVRSLVLIGAQYKMPRGLLQFQNFLFHFLPESSFVSMGISKKDVIKLTRSMLEIDFSSALNEISHPTLILCGEKDKSNLKAAKHIAEHVSNAQLQILKGVGHVVNAEAPAMLATILALFWKLHK